MASQAELDWWNKFADVMAEQWMLTPTMNRMIRSEYEQDYEDYLLREGGSFLEVGCGVGWIGQKFATRGMMVDGIDFSEGQLAIARRMAADKKLDNVAYFARDLINDPLNGRFEEYDSILINAVLHHLSMAEIEALVIRTAAILAPGGRLYIYEPLAPGRGDVQQRAAIWPAVTAVRGFLFLVQRGGKLFRLFKPHFAKAMRDGYTGTSPDEKPIPVNELRSVLLSRGLEIAEEKAFHRYSLGVCMSIVRLKPFLVSLLTPLVPLFYRFDGWLFKTIGWENIGDGPFVLCGMKVRKPKRVL